MFIYLDRDVQKQQFADSLDLPELADTLLWIVNPSEEQLTVLSHAIPDYKGVIWSQHLELNKS